MQFISKWYSHLIYLSIYILNNICSDQISVDKLGKEPLDMNQYKKIFGTCRIPKEKTDELSFHSESNHIVVVRNNNVRFSCILF